MALRRRPGGLVRALAPLVAGALLVAGGALAPGAAGLSTAAAATPAVASTRPGADLTQVSADPWRDPAAVASAAQVVRRSAALVAQPIMGWGVGNPEPRPGVYNWTGLDRRLRFIASTGAQPVIALVGAPDWMKGGTPGTTDWQRLGVAPLPSHDEDFARLAAAVARRYPHVHDFEVWSELKGYWDTATNTWDVAAYTTLYNDVYRALKAVNPHLAVGGPYVDMVTWGAPSAGGHPSALVGPWGTVDQRSLDAVTFWLDHAAGAQFLAVDGGLQTHDGLDPVDPGAAVALFSALDAWLAERTSLPLWWSEYYVGMPGVRGHPARWLALSTAALIQLTTSGAAVALLWDPERYPGSHSPALWTSTSHPGGGRPTGLAAVTALFLAHFPPGRRVVHTGSAAAGVLAAGSSWLAVDATDQPVTLATPAGSLHLAPWQVVVHPG